MRCLHDVTHRARGVDRLSHRFRIQDVDEIDALVAEHDDRRNGVLEFLDEEAPLGTNPAFLERQFAESVNSGRNRRACGGLTAFRDCAPRRAVFAKDTTHREQP